MLPATQGFSLRPHPSAHAAPVKTITGDIARTRDTLSIRYLLAGDIERLRVPPASAPRFADGLWRHTCCELFVARKGGSAYHECNFSPAGAWAAYAFTRTRERAASAQQSPLTLLNPEICAQQTPHALELRARVRLAALAPGYTEAALRIGLSVVVEDRAGALSYWALAHPAAQPDFHHPDAFVLELDEVRN